MADDNQEDGKKNLSTLEDGFEFLNIPVNKLDADQYMADDLDGVTESVFGSGNMAYASLQASQTNAALGDDLNNQNPSDVINNTNNNNGGGRNFGASDFEFNAGELNSGSLKNIYHNTNTDRGLGEGGENNALNPGVNPGNFTASTVGSAGASELSSNVGSFSADSSGLSLREGLNGTDGTSGNDGIDGSSGTDGSGGGENHCCQCTGLIGDINFVLEPGDLIINGGDLDLQIDTLLVTIGDTVSDLSLLISQTAQIIQNFDLTSIVDTGALTQITQSLVETLSENITHVVHNITDVTSTVTDLLQDGLNFEDSVLDIDLNIIDTLITTIDIPVGDIFNSNIDIVADINPALDLVQNTGIITDLPGLDSLSEALAVLGGSVETLQGSVNTVLDSVQGGDLSDLTGVLNDLSDIADDAVNIVDDGLGGLFDDLGIGDANENGDTDVTLDTGIDVVDHTLAEVDLDIIADPVEDLVGDIDLDVDLGVDLFNSDDTDNDSDLTLNTDNDISDTDVLSGDLDTTLDAVEDVVGDIDVDIDLATDILGDQADPLVNDGDGGTGQDTLLGGLGDILDAVVDPVVNTLDNHGDGEIETVLDLGDDLNIDSQIDLLNGENTDDGPTLSENIENSTWTESIIGESGLFDDVLTGDNAEGDALPDPAGSIGEGLGVLDTEPDIDPGSLGGLFG